MDLFNITNDETFLLFLKHQVKGVFDHDCYCNHNPSSDVCIECIKEFIKHSNYQEYFNNLYTWFMEEILTQQIDLQQLDNTSELSNDFIKSMGNKDQILQQAKYFQAHSIINCFKFIHKYLTSEQVSYFCSPWLDGVFSVVNNTNENIEITDLTIFETLCLQGHLETVKWLYKNIESSFNNNNPIQQNLLYFLVCKLCKQNPKQYKNKNTHEILKWLFSLKEFDDFDVHVNYEEFFRHACYYGNTEVVKLLLSLEGDRRIYVHVNDEDAFRYSCVNGNLEIVKLLLSLEGDRRIDVHADNEGAFRYACSHGHLEIVKLLLSLEGDRRIDVHADNEGAFRGACYHDHFELVEFLLNLSGDRTIDVHVDDEQAFRYACYHGHLKLIELLLKLDGDRRIDVHANNEGAFIYACANGHLGVIKLLLKLDGDRRINVHANNEKAFRDSCVNKHLEVVKLLLNLKDDRQVDVYIQNDEVFRKAQKRKYSELITLLEPYYEITRCIRRGAIVTGFRRR